MGAKLKQKPTATTNNNRQKQKQGFRAVTCNLGLVKLKELVYFIGWVYWDLIGKISQTYIFI